MTTILAAAEEILLQGEEVVGSLSDETYRTKVLAVFNSSIGGHYRHCLDHFKAVLDAADLGEIDFSMRRRDVQLEVSRKLALAESAHLRGQLANLSPAALARAITVRDDLGSAGWSAAGVNSTLGRELMYAFSHAIHHYASMSMIGRQLEAKMPAEFGVAPSTIRHQRKQGAA